MPVKKSALYSSLWASCDELRGGMDASQYKDYVLFMLFLKYVSDKYGSQQTFKSPVTIPKGASFADLVLLKGKSDIGDKINKQIVQPLIDANTGKLAKGDFPDFNDANKLGEGQAMVDRLTKLVSIFAELDFSQNRAEHDDLLGDAYEYLMRHFATQSGKSKGQFYTPSEVSRVIAKVIGISGSNAKASTTAYDPTCGSGSLLLKVAAEAGTQITLEGQEMDVTTAGLARMNMILHNFPTANIMSGNTLAEPKFQDGANLRTYDYVVANPPFSVKSWLHGLGDPANDPHQRFAWGIPPQKTGDYAFLLHIIRSMKSTGRAACILPHGVLFRGGAEAVIREKLVCSGCLRGIIGLPANLFYGTGIPACILVLDKNNATARKGVFMLDASRGFQKDGNKNRLRERDIHLIVDTFTQQKNVPRYARMVPLSEIADPKNGYNLNLPRYIDTTEPEDIHSLEAHISGGIPESDIDALAEAWEVLPDVRNKLFRRLRRGYVALRCEVADIKATILKHSEFVAFEDKVQKTFARWRKAVEPTLRDFTQNAAPKQLIADIAETLLDSFRKVPLVDAYALYQHLMDYWETTMQDDCGLIAESGWKTGAQPRELQQARDKKEPHDYELGKRRFKADLIPVSVLIAHAFTAERDAIALCEAEIAECEQQLEEMQEEHSGEDGLLAEGVDSKTLNAQLKELGNSTDDKADRKVLQECLAAQNRLREAKSKLKTLQQELNTKLAAKYPLLTEEEIKTLVVRDKWLSTIEQAMRAEVERVSQTLTGRVRQWAERYATPLPQLVADAEKLAARVKKHLEKMGVEVWK